MTEWIGHPMIPKQGTTAVLLIKIGQKEVKEIVCLKEVKILTGLEIAKEQAVNQLPLEALEIASPASEGAREIAIEKEVVNHNSKEQVCFRDLVKVQLVPQMLQRHPYHNRKEFADLGQTQGYVRMEPNVDSNMYHPYLALPNGPAVLTREGKQKIKNVTVAVVVLDTGNNSLGTALVLLLTTFSLNP